MLDGELWRCVEMNCGAFAANRDDMLCQWHNENRSYRIDRTGTFDGYMSAPNLDAYIDRKVLVPDTRLQAIADAYENYLTAIDVGIGESETRRFLFDLLDALAKEDECV